MARIEWRLATGVATVAIMTVAGQLAGTLPAQAASQVTIAVDTANPAGRLPADFVGLSYEMRELFLGRFDASAGNLVQLFRNLGRGNIRIAGNTLDRDTLWIPAGQQPPNPLPDWVASTVTPADIARLNRFLIATGWHTEVGINLNRWDPVLGPDQAHSMISTLGPRLAGVECGNEPNQWVGRGWRPDPYGYPQYKPEWEVCADAVGGRRLAGPDLAGSNVPWVTQFAQEQRSRLTMLMSHNYVVGATATVHDLLSPQTNTHEVNTVTPQLAAARAVNLPFRLDETNSAASGGIVGVSDRYASALWSMDYVLLMAQTGLAGLDFHGGLSVCGAPLFNGRFQHYTPVCAANTADEQAKVYLARPEYYGLYMATRMGPGTFLPITLSTDRNVTAYAVRGDDGRTRIAVIQKEDTTAEPVHVSVNVGRGNGTAEVVRLTGPALDAADGVAIQGARVDRRGRLPHRPADRVPVRHGALSVDVAAGSAVVVTLDGTCR